MGHALSIDSLSYFVFGVAIAVIGAVAVGQPAQLAHRAIQPSVSYPECGSAASLDVMISTTEPDTENQTYSDGHAAQSEEYMHVPGGNFSGPGLEDREESVESITTIEHLQGIGASFDKIECLGEYDLFEDITNMLEDTKLLGNHWEQPSNAH